MRFITRTLPWVVILVVIAFFIGLKQSSNHPISFLDFTSEEQVTKADTSPKESSVKESSAAQASSSASSKKSDTPSVNSTASTKAPKAADVVETPVELQDIVIILEEPATTDEKSTSEDQDQNQDQKQDQNSPKPSEGQPDLSTTSKESADKSKSSTSTPKPSTKPTSTEQPASDKTDLPEAKTTSLLNSAVLSKLNPPLLSQPITDQDTDSQNDSGTSWEWSEAVQEIQPESSDDAATTSSDASGASSTSSDASSIEDQEEMPNMYGPAKEKATSKSATTDKSTQENATDDSASATDTDASVECDEETVIIEESDDTTSEEQEGESAPKQEATPRKPLSPEMQKLRDSVRQTINTYSQPILNTRDNTVAGLLDVCEAFGCDAEVMYLDQNRKINAFVNLCYNYPCAGYHPMKVSNGRIEPRLGYGFQEKPGQMLAVMALARVPESYPIQFNEKLTGTVADLVRREKETCRVGQDLSFKLIGISRYTPSGETWKSESGQTWTVERLLSEVLKQPARLNSASGTNRLMAISYAVERRNLNGEPMNGTYKKAAKYVSDFQDYALSMINDDGTWHSRFFLSKGVDNSNLSRLRSTGHILRWLVFSLPEERLHDPRIVKAVAQVDRALGGNARYGLATSSPHTIDSRLTAVHALVLYNHRLFESYDDMNQAEEASAVATVPKENESVK